MHNINNKRLDLNLLLAFDAMLREQGVTRAAEKLGITQSAMSHALSRLRQFFNDPLFVRSGDAMKPTPKAQQLGETVLAIISLVQNDLTSQAGFDPDTTRRTFKLSMTDMGELVILPTLIEKLRTLAPHCSIRTKQVSPESVEEALESGEVDLAIGSLSTVPPGLFQQELFRHNFVTIVSAQNTEIGDHISLDQFCRMQHIVVAQSGRADLYDKVIEENGIHRNVYLVTPHFLVIPLILEKNPGMVATVPFELGRVFQKYKGIKMLPPPINIPIFSIRQHWHPRYHHDEANIWLRHIVKETFDGYPDFVI